MALIHLCLRLAADPRHARTPQVRAWIDPDPEATLGTELELPLTCRRAQTWTGTFVIGRAAATGFLYRVGIAAHAGVLWELAIRRAGDERLLMMDADTTAFDKCWLVGTCDLPSCTRGRVVRHSPGAGLRSL